MKRRRRQPWLLRVRSWAIALPLVHRVVGVVLLILVVAATVAALSAANRAAADQTGSNHRYTILDARVVWTRDQFMVSNQSSAIWTRCKMELNATVFGDGYSVLMTEITPGTKYLLPYTQFVRSTGVMYDANVEAPTHFTIRCLDVEGRVGAYVGNAGS